MTSLEHMSCLVDCDISNSSVPPVWTSVVTVSGLASSRSGTGSRVPESTPAGFRVFRSNPDPVPESKICEKPYPDPESLFNFGSRMSLCGHFFSKNMGKFRLDR